MQERGSTDCCHCCSAIWRVGEDLSIIVNNGKNSIGMTMLWVSPFDYVNRLQISQTDWQSINNSRTRTQLKPRRGNQTFSKNTKILWDNLCWRSEAGHFPWFEMFVVSILQSWPLALFVVVRVPSVPGLLGLDVEFYEDWDDLTGRYHQIQLWLLTGSSLCLLFWSVNSNLLISAIITIVCTETSSQTPPYHI